MPTIDSVAAGGAVSSVRASVRLVDLLPSGPGWSHEISHDGFRILTVREGEPVEVWSPQGSRLPPPEATVWGE
jgi:hypothetical protein